MATNAQGTVKVAQKISRGGPEYDRAVLRLVRAVQKHMQDGDWKKVSHDFPVQRLFVPQNLRKQVRAAFDAATALLPVDPQNPTQRGASVHRGNVLIVHGATDVDGRWVCVTYQHSTSLVADLVGVSYAR